MRRFWMGGGSRARARVCVGESGLGCVRLLRSMTVLFDSDVAGQGNTYFGAQRIQYMLFATLTQGSEVKPFSVRDDDYMARIGWVTLGALVTIPDVVEAVFWRAPWWINFLNTEISSIPQTDSAANDFGIWATHVRWSLTDGVLGHLLVVGV